ncbi:MAG: PKD domain-containing protein [Sphaerochaetaceae bacterium]|nr:PKD domain-containing protein [Sphaerochaetaceae bacterium]
MTRTSAQCCVKVAWKLLALCVVGIFLFTLPVSAAVRSAQSRVLSQPDDVVTTVRGNFKAGHLLSTPLISITIVNDPTPAFLLLNLEIKFGGDWADETAVVSLVKKLNANETLTFSNKDMLNYLSAIRKTGSSVSDTLKEKIGISSLDDSSEAIGALVNGLNLPEGEYTIKLTAKEVTLSDPNNIESNITNERNLHATEEVKFKVVHIGAISNVTFPSIDVKTISFNVPMIPVYSAAETHTANGSTSSTKVVISGPGVSQTLSKAHAKSNAYAVGAIKGYPSDTTNGFVSYDVSAVKFRAGKKYSIEISFLDWNGTEIETVGSPKSVEFSTPKLNTAIDTSDPYRPEFSWSYIGSDYSSWTKEYRVYVNGAYRGFTTNNSFKLSTPLSPNTTYSWYVMPINKDDSPFFDSATPLTKTFTTKAHTDLTVSVDQPPNNAILIVGNSYDFSADASYSDGASAASSSWRIGNETKSGLNVSYTPNRRYASNSLSAYASVTDSLGLTKNSTAMYMSVLDPVVAMQGGTALSVKKDTATTFTVDANASRDIARYEWFVNGSAVGTGNRVTQSFSQSGTFQVYVEGTTVADMNGNTKTVRSATTTVEVIGSGPVVSITQPKTVGKMLINNRLDIVASVTNENRLSSVQWTVSGPDTSQSGTSGNQLRFVPTKSGEHTITVTATDIHGLKSSASIRLLAIDPKVTLQSPVNNASFGLDHELTPVIDAPYADSVTWSIGGTTVTGSSYPLKSLGVGNYAIVYTANYNVLGQQGNLLVHSVGGPISRINVVDQNPPKVTIQFPQQGDVLKAGETYRLRAAEESDTPIYERYWEFDGQKINGNSLQIPTSTMQKNVNLSYTAVNSSGIRKTETISVKVINPSLYVVVPQLKEYLIGTTIPITGSVADGELYWIINGIERPDWDKKITTAGTFEVKAGWRAKALDASGNEREYTALSEPVTFTMYSNKAPVISTALPVADVLRERVNRGIAFSVDATSDNSLQPVSWQVIKDNVIIGSSGKSLVHTFNEAGQYTVKATVSDNYGNSISKEWAVKIVDPKISIDNFSNAIVFPKGNIFAPMVTTKDLTSYSLLLDNLIVPEDYDWNSVSVGSHTLKAEGFFTTTQSQGAQKITSDAIAFNVEDRTPPDFELIPTFDDGSRLVVGNEYTLIASPQGNESIQWYVNGVERSGSRLVGDYVLYYTTKSGDKTLTFTAKATLNGMVVEKSVKAIVADPWLSEPTFSPRVNNLLPPDTPITVSYQSRDVDAVILSVDNSPVAGNTITLNPGTHTVGVKGLIKNVTLPEPLNFQTEFSVANEYERQVTVAERTRLTAINMADAIKVNDPLSITVATTGDNNNQNIASITYVVDGKTYKQEKAPVTKQTTITGLSPGSHTITVSMQDVFGKTSTIEKTVNVYKPLQLTINTPSMGTRFSPDAVITARMSANESYSNLRWTVDGNPVAQGQLPTVTIGKLSPGVHTVAVSASDQIGAMVSSSVTVEVQSDFQLNLFAPNEGVELLVGKELTAIAGIEKTIGSQVNLSDAAGKITWFVNGQTTGTTGLSYAFVGKEPGAFRIRAEYRNGAMVKTTPERTVMVRDVVAPTILYPIEGQNISYSAGEKVSLIATGEPGATFTWMNGSQVIAVGPSTSFDPNGLMGMQQIKLVMTAFGITKEQMSSFFFRLNNPPDLTFVVPEIQYTGDRLAWTATAFDVDDLVTNPPIEMSLDGVIFDDETPKVLSLADIGHHVLTAKVIDNNGVATIKQKTFTVEASDLKLEIRSPQDQVTYFSTFAIPLQAALAEQTGNGSFQWTVQYLDAPHVQTETFQGDYTSFVPKATGEVLITARFLDQDQRERGTTNRKIVVAAKPLELGIYWPHGSLVNAGQSLKPTPIGLPDQYDESMLEWVLNGVPIENIENITAPLIPGSHILSLIYTEGKTVNRAEISFTVNQAPSVIIERPMANSQYIVGSQIPLAAKVIDDQQYDQVVRWTNSNGDLLGEGNPLIITPDEAKTNSIKATAIDRNGAQGTAEIQFATYVPIKDVAIDVHGGLSTYLLTEQALPLHAKASYAGGINPVVTWVLQQGDQTIQRQGDEAYFISSEFARFTEGFASISVSITDQGLLDEQQKLVFTGQYPLEITKNATVSVLSPTSADAFRVGQAIVVRLSLVGFSAPRFATTLDQVAIENSFTLVDGVSTYETEIPATAITEEGVHELLITVQENGIERILLLTVNVYKPRTGVFVDKAPISYTIGETGKILTAVVESLTGVDSLKWYSDLTIEPIGTGSTLDLSDARLVPGKRSIRVEAFAGSESISSFTTLVDVSGPMTLAIIPIEEPMIVVRGADVTLSALAFDHNGQTISSDSIIWTSHLDGMLNVGDTLNLAALGSLTAGNHVITVEATGIQGDTITVLKKLSVIAPEGRTQSDSAGSNDQEQDQQDQDDEEDQDSGSFRQQNFDDGMPLPPFEPPTFGPFGPGGAPPDPGLGNIFGNFYNNFGGPMGFGGMGGTPFMGW